MAQAPIYARLTNGAAADAGQQDVVDMVVVSDGLTGHLTGSATAVNNAATFADLAAATTAYNTLLAALRTRGIITGS
ncbi:hypothetical protein ACIQU5_31915 [Streptomyces sp. NPDC090306]|uniref:hypothetical protein n=1 Tax=Streptomyces sp. NPDC090306 TaxID=3365961 RepID=UPI00380DD250